MDDLQSLYSLRTTIANLRELESRLIDDIHSRDQLPAKELNQLLSVERLLVNTINSAIDVETKLGKLMDGAKFQAYVNLMKGLIERYIKDDTDRMRFIADFEQALRELDSVNEQA